jgi:hypothetical protein
LPQLNIFSVFQLLSSIVICALALRAIVKDARSFYGFIRRRLLKIGQEQKIQVAELRLRSDGA